MALFTADFIASWGQDIFLINRLFVLSSFIWKYVITEELGNFESHYILYWIVVCGCVTYQHT